MRVRVCFFVRLQRGGARGSLLNEVVAAVDGLMVEQRWRRG
jgi:hypothetical protein